MDENYFDEYSLEDRNVRIITSFLVNQENTQDDPCLYNDFHYQDMDDYDRHDFSLSVPDQALENGLEGVLAVCDKFKLGENFKKYYRDFFASGYIPPGIKTAEERKKERGLDPERYRSKRHPIPAHH